MLKVTKAPRVPRLRVDNLLCNILYFHSIMLKVTKVPRVPRLQVGNLLCIVLYFHSIMLKVTKVPMVPRQSVMYFHSVMLKVTKVPMVPRLQVGNLLYVTVCHRLNNAQSSQDFQLTSRQSVMVFDCHALKFPCSPPVEKRFYMC